MAGLAAEFTSHPFVSLTLGKRGDELRCEEPWQRKGGWEASVSRESKHTISFLSSRDQGTRAFCWDSEAEVRGYP